MDLATGKVVKITQHFHSEVILINEATNIEEKYREIRDTILEKVANFQPQKSRLQFSQVLYLDINISPYKPLDRSSYLPTPEYIRYRNAIQNIQNRFDHKCFIWVQLYALL